MKSLFFAVAMGVSVAGATHGGMTEDFALQDIASELRRSNERAHDKAMVEAGDKFRATIAEINNPRQEPEMNVNVTVWEERPRYRVWESQEAYDEAMAAQGSVTYPIPKGKAAKPVSVCDAHPEKCMTADEYLADLPEKEGGDTVTK